MKRLLNMLAPPKAIADRYDAQVRDRNGPWPIPMILFCPNCGAQHIDASEPSLGRRFQDPGRDDEWTNPPHRSHLCADCGHVWRPADVCTMGVAEITTRGMIDDEPPIRGDVNRRASEGG